MLNEDAYVNAYAEMVAKVKAENELAAKSPEGALTNEALCNMISMKLVEIQPEVTKNPKLAQVYTKLVDIYARLRGFTKTEVSVICGPEALAKKIAERESQ